MENKIKNAFDGKKAFIAFITAGDPDLESTENFVLALEKAGVDLIELGIPFSDPVSDGKVIQKANIRALSNGTTLEKIFATVEKLRTKTRIPIVFLTYLNPVFKYGYDKFFKDCTKAGVDGVIIPDMPFEEQSEIKEYSEKYGVDIISFIVPTSNKRVELIAKEAKGFIYVASSMGVTGVRAKVTDNLTNLIEQAKKVTKTPCAVGFGISTPEQINEINKIADGTIVGSAIVKIIEKYGKDASPHLEEYVKSLKAGV